MKTLDARSATDEYMSTHSLTFSTPDLILKEFVIWLCEQVSTRDEKEQIPSLNNNDFYVHCCEIFEEINICA